MQDLKDVTNSIHYELYRSEKLTRLVSQNQVKNFIKIELHIAIKGANMQKNPTTSMEDEQQESLENVEKMENEMNDIFSKKVNEKIEKIKSIEKEEVQNIEKQMQELK